MASALLTFDTYIAGGEMLGKEESFCCSDSFLELLSLRVIVLYILYCMHLCLYTSHHVDKIGIPL